MASASILTDVKKLLDIPEEYTAYDVDIILHINTFLRRLNQLGVGVKNFQITGSSETWEQFLQDEAKFAQAKSYVFARARLLFDPPANTSAVKALEETSKELEWLLNVEAEHVESEVGD